MRRRIDAAAKDLGEKLAQVEGQLEVAAEQLRGELELAAGSAKERVGGLMQLLIGSA
jgi:hypothetical protein